MSVARALMVRNLKLYFRDKTAVFMSMLSVLIIIVIYALFLEKINSDSLKKELGVVDNIEWFVGAWIMAGIIVVNSLTTSLAAFSSLVKDREEKRLAGFLVAPISKATLVSGYLFSAWIIGTVMTLLTFILAQVYICILGGELLSFFVTMKVIALIILNVFSSTAFAFFLVGCIKSASSFSLFSTIIGTMIGFVTGVYTPIGLMPSFVQIIIKIIPITHGTVLMRQLFMTMPVKEVFANVPMDVKSDFLQHMGVELYINNRLLSPELLLLSVFLSGILFIGLSIMMFQKKL